MKEMFIEAAEADALTIIALRRRIWDTTYRGIYPDSMIDDFDWDWHKERELSIQVLVGVLSCGSSSLLFRIDRM